MPHRGQKVVISNTARFKWLSAGRRWRKTTLAMTVAVEAAIKGKSILWGSPTFDQCNVGWNEMYKAAGSVFDFRRSRMECVTPTGGRVIFRSLDNPDNARGHTADGVIIDEAPLILATAWYDVLRPIISDTRGWALLMGTPKGRNWFWREFMAAQDAEDSAAWQVPTLGVAFDNGRLVRQPHLLENPDFPFDEAENIYRSVPSKTFEQEFLAQFIEDAGLVFRGVRAVSTVKPGSYARFERYNYIFGVDWARSYDWTVISVIDATNGVQVAKERFNQIDYQFQLGRLRAMCDIWQPSLIMAEANAMGTPLIEQLQRANLPVRAFTTTAQSKAEIIEGLALAIERGSVKLLNDETQIAEAVKTELV